MSKSEFVMSAIIIALNVSFLAYHVLRYKRNMRKLKAENMQKQEYIQMLLSIHYRKLHQQAKNISNNENLN